MSAEPIVGTHVARRSLRPTTAATAGRLGLRGPSETAAAGSRRVVLVVDDEPMLGALLAMALDSQGWQTVVATAAEPAEDLARELEVDLLVTDVHMPGRSGFDLATSLRSRRADLPVLLVSGAADAAALALPQPFAFLEKPFSLRSLFGAIGLLVPTERPGAGGRAPGAGVRLSGRAARPGRDRRPRPIPGS